MISEYLRLHIPLKDNEFDAIYPANIRKMSKRHFTPVDVAIKASQLLITKPKQKILDIGCGAGKFCFVAGATSEAQYTGVDYREKLIELCKKITNQHRFKNVHFIHKNILKLDFSKYDAFYFFNSFQEQIDASAKIDNEIATSKENYKTYSDYIKKQFEKMPDGTRIVTYYADGKQIPASYRLVCSHFNGLLLCWEKSSNFNEKLYHDLH